MPGPPPSPPPDFRERALKLSPVSVGVALSRIHRLDHEPLHFGKHDDAERRQRWDAPDVSYGVCYMAGNAHVAFAKTLLRDLTLDVVHEQDLHLRSLALVEVCAPLRLVAMHGKGLRAHGADASVVHGPYPNTWKWSAAIHAHPSAPDGISYRARHDDSGHSVALFERARDKVVPRSSIQLLHPTLGHRLAQWLDGYGVGLTS